MEDFFPNYLRQNIQPIKLAECKSKGKVICSCGCDVFDYNYLFFKYTPTEEIKKMAEISKRDDEMLEKRVGPYKNYVRGDIKFLAGWTIVKTTDGKEYWVMFVGSHSTHYDTIEEAMQAPNYVGHVEKSPYDPNKPTEYNYIFAQCKHCGKKFLLLDDRYYGYDGLCTHCEQPNKPYLDSGKLKIKKPHCVGAGYKIFVTIDSTGKDDLFEGTDGVITDENWKDAFNWIKIDLECSECGKKKNVLNLETM